MLGVELITIHVMIKQHSVILSHDTRIVGCNESYSPLWSFRSLPSRLFEVLLASPITIIIIISLQDTHQLRDGSQDHQDVEDLMGCSVDVKLARSEAFRKSCLHKYHVRLCTTSQLCQ